jgi:hypothetical protein
MHWETPIHLLLLVESLCPPASCWNKSTSQSTQNSCPKTLPHSKLLKHIAQSTHKSPSQKPKPIKLKGVRYFGARSPDIHSRGQRPSQVRAIKLAINKNVPLKFAACPLCSSRAHSHGPDERRHGRTGICRGDVGMFMFGRAVQAHLSIDCFCRWGFVDVECDDFDRSRDVVDRLCIVRIVFYRSRGPGRDSD